MLIDWWEGSKLKVSIFSFDRSPQGSAMVSTRNRILNQKPSCLCPGDTHVIFNLLWEILRGRFWARSLTTTNGNSAKSVGNWAIRIAHQQNRKRINRKRIIYFGRTGDACGSLRSKSEDRRHPAKARFFVGAAHLKGQARTEPLAITFAVHGVVVSQRVRLGRPHPDPQAESASRRLLKSC